MKPRSIDWPLAGYPDDVVLASAGDRLWAAASTATLATEEVWLCEVVADSVVDAARVREQGACCRPAITAFPDGALAVACTTRGIAGAYLAGGGVARWELAVVGVPVHLAVHAGAERAWLAAELVHGSERSIALWCIDPATGAIVDHRTLGGGGTWCRWPAVAHAEGTLLVAWCEGPARRPGSIKIGPWSDPRAARDVSIEAGDAPALAVLPDGAVAVAWHHGGPTTSGDARDASVVRTIEVALVRGGSVVLASPPPGAGGVAPRGEDQGWELAAVAADHSGGLLLVGRSTHGHHVARRTPDGTWTAPLALDDGGWGGRGRRHDAILHNDDVWLGRRAPSGIVIGVCSQPIDGLARARPSRQVTLPRRRAARGAHDVLFGDLHQHTAHSDGCGSVEDLWMAARDERGLDFAAITDHDQFCRRALGPATWALTTSVAAAFDEPGRFVAIAGYEFTGPRHPGPGHKCVYFGDRVPERVPDRNVDTLFALLREYGGLAVPHHVAWTGADFAHHDPELQPVWEICSVHGCYEGEGACAAHPPRTDHVIPGHFVRDALAAGLRFGFVGSTDSHGLDWHHGIARWRNPFHAGLACVVGAEPTRAGVIAALRARRTYATSGAKIVVHATLDGAPIGSELPAGTTGELLVEVTGTAPITAIVLVEDGAETALAVDGRGSTCRARTRIRARDRAYNVYVRIEQADRELAWTSPFWIG